MNSEDKDVVNCSDESGTYSNSDFRVPGISQVEQGFFLIFFAKLLAYLMNYQNFVASFGVLHFEK